MGGYDGIIAGVPTWHTGADEQRSGTAFDDYLEEIRGLDMCGKPVAIFGIGYTDAAPYDMYTESKSVKDGKFLGLPLDGDNEPDMSEARVKSWVEQLKSEGMPVM